MIMILDVDVTAERRHHNTYRPQGDTATLGAKGPVKPKNPWAEGPSILRTFPSEPSEPSEPFEPYEPSHRRCVQWRSWIGGGERSEPIRRMLIMPYDTESKSHDADFISIARRAIHNPRGQRPRQT